jgi:small subunit ribosomal protein S7
MPRRKRVEPRKVDPDPKFGDLVVAKFISKMMQDGKRATAERIFYQAMERIEAMTKQEPLAVFKQAMNNSRPHLEVKSRRVGGATYQVPVEVRPNRAQALAMRWLLASSRGRGEKSMTDKLANELVDAAAGRGATVKKRDDTHRMAEANKAFAHYRW